MENPLKIDDFEVPHGLEISTCVAFTKFFCWTITWWFTPPATKWDDPPSRKWGLNGERMDPWIDKTNDWKHVLPHHLFVGVLQMCGLNSGKLTIKHAGMEPAKMEMYIGLTSLSPIDQLFTRTYGGWYPRRTEGYEPYTGTISQPKHGKGHPVE